MERVKEEKERKAAASSLATEQQGQSIKRMHPAITSPTNASQPGAPCNCVPHQRQPSHLKEPRWKPALLETQAGHAQVAFIKFRFTLKKKEKILKK